MDLKTGSVLEISQQHSLYSIVPKLQLLLVGTVVASSVGIMLDTCRAEAEVYYRDNDFENIGSNTGNSRRGRVTDIAVMGQSVLRYPSPLVF